MILGRWQVALGCSLLWAGCERAPDRGGGGQRPRTESVVEGPEVPAQDVVAQEVAAPVDTRRCKPGPGTTGSPSTIDEMVALVNGLPRPVTAPCVIEALDRPLELEATSSRDSVQPADGQRSPRIFIWPHDELVVAIALAGKGQALIELGQFVTPSRSVKAELEFPVHEPVTAEQALAHVRNPEHPRITRCFVCHDLEEDEPLVPGGRSSLALRPAPRTLVDIASLSQLHETCDPTEDASRCAWLEALVTHGPIEHRPFDDAIGRF